MISPLQQRNKPKSLTGKDLPQLHHDFMMCYGWIPLKEFKEFPIKNILTLNPLVQEEKQKRESQRVYMIRLLAGFVGAKKLKDYK